MAELFENEPHKSFYNFSRFDQLKNLIKEYLMEYPKSKISCKYIRPMSNGSDVIGICCRSERGEDADILDGLLGYIDIPAGMNGLVTDLVRKTNVVSYLVAYDQKKIHPSNIRNLNFLTCGGF